MVAVNIPYICHICNKEFEFNSEFIKTDWAKYQNKKGYPICVFCWQEKRSCKH